MTTALSTETISQLLTPKEFEEYSKYIESGKPPLSRERAEGFFALYTLGLSCEEIARLNPGFGVGIILRARVDFLWDQKAEDISRVLQENTYELYSNAKSAAIRFAALGVATYHKLVGEKFQKYLQSGDQSQLGDLKDMGFKQYKEFLEILKSLNGDETVKHVYKQVHVTTTANNSSPVQVDGVVTTSKEMSTSKAEDLVKSLLERQKGGSK